MWLEPHLEFPYMPAWRGQENIYLFQILYSLLLDFGVQAIYFANRCFQQYSIQQWIKLQHDWG